MEDNNLEKVIEFFSRYTTKVLNEKTEINNDLDLMGDDADAMLLDFMERFNIDLIEVDFTDYFVPELIFIYWYYKWFKPEKLKKKPLTIRHMAEVVKKGYWFYPTG